MVVVSTSVIKSNETLVGVVAAGVRVGVVIAALVGIGVVAMIAVVLDVVVVVAIVDKLELVDVDVVVVVVVVVVVSQPLHVLSHSPGTLAHNP